MPRVFVYHRIDPADLAATCPRCSGRLRRPPGEGEVPCPDCGAQLTFEESEALRRAKEFFHEYLLGLDSCPPAALYWDVADAGRAAEDRPTWSWIWREIGSGDLLITMLDAWGDGGDAVATLGRVLGLAQVHIVRPNGLALVIEPRSLTADVLRMIAENLDCSIKDRIRANRAAKARERNEPRNQYAGRGFRWERDNRIGRFRRVPDTEIQALMQRIVDLKDGQGYSWPEIDHLFKAEGLTGPRGRPWAVRSLQRMYADGLRLFADETAEAA